MNNVGKTALQLGIKRGDIILAAVLLVASVAAGLLLFRSQPGQAYVSVRVDGEEIALLPLDTDRTFPVGDGNIIEISGGSVRMTYADCPDKICVKTGSISHSGQSIVCAPHKLVIIIVDGQKDNHSSYDVITN